MSQDIKLGQIVEDLGGELVGSADAVIRCISPIDDAGSDSITFLSSIKAIKQLESCQAACVIVAPSVREQALARGAAIITDQPYLYFAKLTQWWVARHRQQRPARVHPSAVIDPTARLGVGVDVGALAVIEAGAMIGDGAVIGAQSFIGEGASVGADSRLAPHVTLMHACHVGERCIIHSGAVIGADGFGFAPLQGEWIKIEQLGGVSIGHDVEIGANTCIDRGALRDTRIADGVKLDNQIQVGHNVEIGKHTAIAGCTGIAGSAKIGEYCTIAGASMIIGHLQIADRVHVGVGTAVTRSITQSGAQYSGVFPMDEHKNWEKNAATLRQLHSLRERVRTLEKNQSTSPVSSTLPINTSDQDQTS